MTTPELQFVRRRDDAYAQIGEREQRRAADCRGNRIADGLRSVSGRIRCGTISPTKPIAPDTATAAADPDTVPIKQPQPRFSKVGAERLRRILAERQRVERASVPQQHARLRSRCTAARSTHARTTGSRGCRAASVMISIAGKRIGRQVERAGSSRPRASRPRSRRGSASRAFGLALQARTATRATEARAGGEQRQHHRMQLGNPDRAPRPRQGPQRSTCRAPTARRAGCADSLAARPPRALTSIVGDRRAQHGYAAGGGRTG